jgi:hypothetical protein
VSMQPMPSWATYAEAMNKFRRSATAFMEQVYLLTEARSAYREAMAVGTELRHSLDTGDEVLRSVMSQLERVINDHLSEPALDRKRPELLKEESIEGNEGSAHRLSRPFP